MIFARRFEDVEKLKKKNKLADHSGEKKYNRVVCDLNQIMNPIWSGITPLSMKENKW